MIVGVVVAVSLALFSSAGVVSGAATTATKADGPTIVSIQLPHGDISSSGATIDIVAKVERAATCQLTLGTHPWVNVDGFKSQSASCAKGLFQTSVTFDANSRPEVSLVRFHLFARKGGSSVERNFILRVSAATTATTPTSSSTTTTSTITPSQPVRSPYWAGYLVQGPAGSYQAVSAEWTVPTLDCAATPNAWTSIWVGLDGTTGHLFQTGIEPGCVNGALVDEAWWTDQALDWGAQDVFAVKSGDVIRAEVSQVAAGEWEYYIADLTSGLSSEHVESSSEPASTAEWIAENPPPTQGASPGTLVDFGSVTFSDLGLKTTTGSWTDPPYSDAWEIVGSDGSIEAAPSLFSGEGAAASFTVTYEG